MGPDQRLADLGHRLPETVASVADYVPATYVNGLLYVSGQLPFQDGVLMMGRCGEDRDVEFGRMAAERCGLMLLAQVRMALGSLERIERIAKLGVFVCSTADFTAHSKVADGASRLLRAVFGEAGRHARSTVAVPGLPLGAIVEVDAVVAVRD